MILFPRALSTILRILMRNLRHFPSQLATRRWQLATRDSRLATLHSQLATRNSTTRILPTPFKKLFFTVLQQQTAFLRACN